MGLGLGIYNTCIINDVSILTTDLEATLCTHLLRLGSSIFRLRHSIYRQAHCDLQLNNVSKCTPQPHPPQHHRHITQSLRFKLQRASPYGRDDAGNPPRKSVVEGYPTSWDPHVTSCLCQARWNGGLNRASGDAWDLAFNIFEYLYSAVRRWAE